MNMMYPMFILVACKSDPLKAYKEGMSGSSFIASIISEQSKGRLSGLRIGGCVKPRSLPEIAHLVVVCWACRAGEAKHRYLQGCQLGKHGSCC